MVVVWFGYGDGGGAVVVLVIMMVVVVTAGGGGGFGGRGGAWRRAKYALEILNKYGIDKCDTIGTLLAVKPKLDADLSGLLVDQTRYHSMIGALMYLTSSRPDLVHAVCYYARYQARPTEKHLKEMAIMLDALILAKARLVEYNSWEIS
ncbi:hypothetical protein Tco_0575592 [Tanacetum coccineum]